MILDSSTDSAYSSSNDLIRNHSSAPIDWYFFVLTPENEIAVGKLFNEYIYQTATTNEEFITTIKTRVFNMIRMYEKGRRRGLLNHDIETAVLKRSKEFLLKRKLR